MFGILAKKKPKAASPTQEARRDPTEPTMTPPQTRSDMPRQPMLTLVEEIPPHTQVLSISNGPVGLRTADMKVVAILEIGKGKAALLWTGNPEDVDTRDAARSRAKSAGFEVISISSASADVIAFCHDQETQTSIAEEQKTDELETSEATDEFDNILTQALELKATDIHFCPDERTATVRLRVNGDLRDLRPMIRSKMDAMIRAMYTQTEEESRSGSVNFKADDYLGASLVRTIQIGRAVRTVKMRWASGPGVGSGHDVVLRILAKEAGLRKLTTLGWRKEQVEALQHALRLPEGIILLVGVTGSGKSTTIASSAYEWLQRYSGKRSLRTIEDPVEIIIPGARHMSIPSSGEEEELHNSDFGRGLRSILRMDPDGIFVGEVRDKITADLIMQAQQTGHKVFATLHAPSPFEAYSRLIRLGVEKRDLLGESAINMIAYQRLVPILCSECSSPWDQATETVPEGVRQEIEDTFAANLQNIRVRGPGCHACGTTKLKGDGAIGRQALVHVLIPDANFRHLMSEGHEMLAEAYWRGGLSEKHGGVHTITLHDSAKQLIRAGMVCPLDATKALGSVIDPRPPAEEARWYNKHSGEVTPHKANHGR